MELFSLEKWLENPSRKVVTRLKKSVQIISIEGKEDIPIVALIEGVAHQYKPNGYHADVVVAHSNQCRDMGDYDLFFADEEERLTEFEADIYNKIRTVVDAFDGKSRDEVLIPIVKTYAKELLDLSRKEIEKENSEFKSKFTYNEKDYSELANKLIEFRNNTPLCSVSYRDGEGRKIILHYEKEILDLVKKELLKDLPKWKKVPSGIKRKELFNMMHKGIVTTFEGYKDYYYLDKTDLGKLPKEE